MASIPVPTFSVLTMFALGCLVFTFVFAVALLIARRNYRKLKHKNGKQINVGFFHPYCNAGGGGERVLWCAIQALQSEYSSIKIYVYTGDTNASPQEILQKAERRFNLKLSDIEFVYLHKRSWVEAYKYPRFTLLGQSLGSVILGLEALNSFVPDIYVDTMGYAFTLPIFSFLAGCKTVSYVHYPTITTEMIQTVRSRQASYNNRNYIAGNRFLSLFKLVYYKIFAMMYRFVGRFSDIVMVNSSWTQDHINSLWKCPMGAHRVYPPCDTSDLQTIPLERNTSHKIKIVSVSQFRKEKNHPLQLRTLDLLRQLVPEEVWEMIELVFIGSTRNDEDEVWVKDLQDMAKHFSLEQNVTFKINIPYSELKTELAESKLRLF